MADEGFGSDLWKNLQEVRFTPDGGLQAPVRANGRDGIVVGRAAVAKAENSSGSVEPKRGGGRHRALFKRLLSYGAALLLFPLLTYLLATADFLTGCGDSLEERCDMVKVEGAVFAGLVFLIVLLVVSATELSMQIFFYGLRKRREEEAALEEGTSEEVEGGAS